MFSSAVCRVFNLLRREENGAWFFGHFVIHKYLRNPWHWLREILASLSVRRHECFCLLMFDTGWFLLVFQPLNGSFNWWYCICFVFSFILCDWLGNLILIFSMASGVNEPDVTYASLRALRTATLQRRCFAFYCLLQQNNMLLLRVWFNILWEAVVGYK